jgi:MYXO-CTERM domain-containing protein
VGGQYFGAHHDVVDGFEVEFSDNSTESIAALGAAGTGNEVWIVACQDLPTCVVSSGMGCATGGQRGTWLLFVGGLGLLGRTRRRILETGCEWH